MNPSGRRNIPSIGKIDLKKSEDQTYCFSQSTTLNNNESI